MPNLGVQVALYMNGVPVVGADGFQVAFLTVRDVAYFGNILCPSWASVANYTGATTIDTGIDIATTSNTNLASTVLYVQTPGRDVMSLTDAPDVSGHNYSLSAVMPFLQCLPYPGVIPITPALTTADIIKCHFVKVRFRACWDSSANLLKERWIGGGGDEWTGQYDAPGGVTYARLRDQTWWVPGQANDGDWGYETGLGVEDPVTHAWSGGYLAHGYTDVTSGEVDYIFLAGWALGRSTGYGTWSYQCFSPGTSYGGDTQNIACYVDYHGCHGRKNFTMSYNDTTPPSYPWSLGANDAGHKHDQTGLGAAVDYATGWNTSTGMLTCPTPPLTTHTYLQGVNVSVTNALGTPAVGATVTIGGRTGTTDGAGKCTITVPPKGSTLAGILPWCAWGDTLYAGQSWYYPRVIKTVSTMPVHDTAPFAGAKQAYCRPSTYGRYHEYAAIDQYGTLDYDPSGILDASNAGGLISPGTGTTLPISGGALSPVVTPYSANYWDGGECVAIEQDLQVVLGGNTKHYSVLVFEDVYSPVTISDFDISTSDGTRSDDLDWSVSPFGEPLSLLDARDPGIRDWRPIDREASFDRNDIIVDINRRNGPSQVFLPDHRRLMAYIASTGAPKLAYSDNGDFWAVTPEIALPMGAESKVVGVTLRTDCDGSLQLFLVGASGAVLRSESRDSGITWSAAAALSGVTADPTAFRADARLDARGAWLAVAQAGGIHLFRSTDLATWTDKGLAIASGRAPRLFTTAEGDLLLVYTLTTTLYSMRGAIGSGDALTWDAPVTIDAAVTANTGATGFSNNQKIALAYKDGDREALQFARSYDSGATWTLNTAEG